MSANKQIVIVGGGMVGISLALLLAEQAIPAWQISLIERHSLAQDSQAAQPSFDARSTAINRGTMALLTELNINLGADATPIAAIQVSDRGHYGSSLLDGADYAGKALGYVVENRHLGSHLLARLQQTSVICRAPAQVSHCQPLPDGYQLTLSQDDQQQALRADLLIIADGADSPLRQTLGITSQTRDYKQTALVANVELAASHHNMAYERFTDTGPIALLPLANCDGLHRAALVWTLDNRQLAQLQALDENALLKELHTRFGYRAGRLNHIGQRDYYPLQRITADEQIRSNLVLMGNAAHFLHPVAGQGFNLALRDCRELTQVLAQAHGQGESVGAYTTLKRYLQRQQQDQALTTVVTDQLVSWFSNESSLAALGRQLGLQTMNLLPPLQAGFVRQMMGEAP